MVIDANWQDGVGEAKHEGDGPIELHAHHAVDQPVCEAVVEQAGVEGDERGRRQEWPASVG